MQHPAHHRLGAVRADDDPGPQHPVEYHSMWVGGDRADGVPANLDAAPRDVAYESSVEPRSRDHVHRTGQDTARPNASGGLQGQLLDGMRSREDRVDVEAEFGENVPHLGCYPVAADFVAGELRTVDHEDARLRPGIAHRRGGGASRRPRSDHHDVP